MLRTASLRSVGGFDERLNRAEDTELWFRLARLGFRFVDAECLGVAYRRTQGSLVTGAPAAQLESLFDVFERAEQPDPSRPRARTAADTRAAVDRRRRLLTTSAGVALCRPDRRHRHRAGCRRGSTWSTTDRAADDRRRRRVARTARPRCRPAGARRPEGGGLRGGAPRRAHSPRPASRRGVETIGRSDDVGAADWRSYAFGWPAPDNRRSEPSPASSPAP